MPLPALRNETRIELIEWLCGYPPLMSRDGRDAWLMHLPRGVQRLIVKRHDNCEIDLAHILGQVQGIELGDGQLTLLILLDPLITSTAGLSSSTKLLRLRQQAEAELRQTSPVVAASGRIDRPPSGNELVIGRDEMVSIDWLEDGLQAARAVARLQVSSTIGGAVNGTGWLIAPTLLLTNHHVVQARLDDEPAATEQEMRQQVQDAVAWFGYDAGSYSEYRCRELLHFSFDLDFALVRMTEASMAGESLAQWGYLRVVSVQPNLKPGARLNIIQHPGGHSKRLALRSNFYIGSVPEAWRLHYLSDTEGGSSGSPVLNDNWRVVALHHGWETYDHYYSAPPVRLDSLGLQYAHPSGKASGLVANVNEGIPIHAILQALPSELHQEIERAQGWS